MGESHDKPFRKFRQAVAPVYILTKTLFKNTCMYSKFCFTKMSIRFGIKCAFIPPYSVIAAIRVSNGVTEGCPYKE